jgi:hypothetical protein
MKITTLSGQPVEINTEKIIILLNPYTYNPSESFIHACEIVYWLRKTYPNPVFSPILHTHGYDQFCAMNFQDNQEDYYWWDLQVYKHLKSDAIMLFTSDWESSKGCRLEMTWSQQNIVPSYLLIE